jgi:hypothetical protein
VASGIWPGDERGLEDRSRTFHALRAEALDPFAHRLCGRIELTCRRGLAHAEIHYGTNHLLSTFWGQAGILMRVHSVLRESLGFGDISVPGSGRMDNLLEVHS